MGELLTAMVGYDAFTQALTNPLLAPAGVHRGHVHPGRDADHQEDATLQQILARNAASADAFVRFTYGPERRCPRPAGPPAAAEPRHLGIRAVTPPSPKGGRRARSGEDEGSPTGRNTPSVGARSGPPRADRPLPRRRLRSSGGEDRVRLDQRARRRHGAAGDRLHGLLQRHRERQPRHPRRRDRRRRPAADLGQRGRRRSCSATASRTCARCPSTSCSRPSAAASSSCCCAASAPPA